MNSMTPPWSTKLSGLPWAWADLLGISKCRGAMRRPAALLAVGIVVLLQTFNPVLAASSVPELVNYQGRLTDENGAAIADKTYKLEFNIYSAVSDNSRVWGPQVFPSVQVVDGYFNVILSKETDANGVELGEGR